MAVKSKYLGIITREIIWAKEDATAYEIAKIMKDNNVGIVVIMRNEEIAGIVSERDITRRVVAQRIAPESIQAKDFMTKEVVTVEFKEGLNKIYQKLCEINFRHLLITDNGKLVGITSRRDLLDALAAKNKW